MESTLGDITLRDGSTARALCIPCPAPEWRDRIASFLKHKGEPWNWHIATHLDGHIDGMDLRFYIALVGEEIISEMMLVERLGLAILGHVFTCPERREQGATTGLMQLMIDDFADRDGIAMHLYTGFESPAYRIYSRFGFEPVRPGWGMMRWVRHPDRYEAFFSPDASEDVRVERTCWTHWALIHKLMVREEGDWLRNANLGLIGPNNAEDAFVHLMSRLRAGKPYDSAVLVNPAGMTVGLATLQPYQRFPSRMLQLDVYAHPTAIKHVSMLIEAIDLPADQPVLVEIDSESVDRRRALKDAGFDEVGRVKAALSSEGDDLDLVLLQV